MAAARPRALSNHRWYRLANAAAASTGRMRSSFPAWARRGERAVPVLEPCDAMGRPVARRFVHDASSSFASMPPILIVCVGDACPTRGTCARFFAVAVADACKWRAHVKVRKNRGFGNPRPSETAVVRPRKPATWGFTHGNPREERQDCQKPDFSAHSPAPPCIRVPSAVRPKVASRFVHSGPRSRGDAHTWRTSACPSIPCAFFAGWLAGGCEPPRCVRMTHGDYGARRARGLDYGIEWTENR